MPHEEAVQYFYGRPAKTFDKVFDVRATHSEVFEYFVDLLDQLPRGCNVTFMVYGPSGSGKTWTMGTANKSTTNNDNCGLIQRTVEFSQKSSQKSHRRKCLCRILKYGIYH